MKRNFVFCLGICLLLFAGMAWAADQSTTTMKVDVFTDASDKSTVNYLPQDGFRQHNPLVQAPGAVAAQGHHYAGAEDGSPIFTEGKKIEKYLPAVYRYQIDNFLAKFSDVDQFSAQAFSLYNISVPAEFQQGGDLVQIITDTTTPDDKIFIGSSMSDALGSKQFANSKHLLFWCLGQTLNAGGRTIAIYGEGTDKFLKSSGFQVGAAAGGGVLSHKEDYYGQAVAGISYSDSETKYTKPPYIQIMGGWLVSKDELRWWWKKYGNYISRCVPSEAITAEFIFSVNDPLEGMGFWQTVKLMHIEHWLLEQRFMQGCGMPIELAFAPKEARKKESATERQPESMAAKPEPAKGSKTGQLVVDDQFTSEIFSPDVLYIVNTDKFLNDTERVHAEQQANRAVAIAPKVIAARKKILTHSTASEEGSNIPNLVLSMKRSKVMEKIIKTALLENGVVKTQAEVDDLVQAVASGEEWQEFPEKEKNRRSRLLIGQVISQQ